MRQFLDHMQRYAWLRTLVYIVIGILLLVEPKKFFNGVVYLLAAYIAIMGIMNLVTTYRMRKDTGFVGFGVTSGVLLLIAALAILVLSKPIISFFPIFFGVVLIIQGLVYLMQQPKGPRVVNGRRWPRLLFGLCLLIVGLLLLFNPFKSILLALQLAGVVIILSGIETLVTSIRSRN